MPESKGVNTRIDYLYRDASNYKVFNSEVVSGVFSSADIQEMKTCLSDGEFFIPEQVGLPENRFDSLSDDDHIWFELYPETDISETDAAPTLALSCEDLMRGFRTAKKNWDEIGAMRRLGII